MKTVRCLLSVSLLFGTGAAVAASTNYVKAAWFEADITPPVGSLLVGYGTNDYSVAKHDELKAIGLAVSDGVRKVVIISVDVLGLGEDSIREIRRRVAKTVGTDETSVMVSSTHTHEGPMTDMYRAKYRPESRLKFDETPGSPEMRNMERIVGGIDRAAREMMAREWKDYVPAYYSLKCDETRNRRYTTADNHASFNAHRPVLQKLTDEIADRELGTLILLNPNHGLMANQPAFVLGNFAAHPLSAHAPGLGGVRISSDFPGFYRRYIERETGANAMFVQGAAGDLVPKEDEMGLAAAQKTGEALAKASVFSIVSAQRCHARFAMARPRVGSASRTFTSRLRKRWRKGGCETQTFEIQCVAIGDVCFVGVPGETVCEIGLEIKWHSPFRRTFVGYLATGYYEYIVTENQMVAGGYESQSHRFASRDSLKLVETARDAMFDLHAKLFPEDDEGDDPYPDNLSTPLVNVPEMYKGDKYGR